LLICLAPEIDLRYERLYAYLQDDVTRKRPTVDLALNLLCFSLEAKLEARQRFTDSSPLIQRRLLHLSEDSSLQISSLLSKYLKIDEWVASYLLGSDGVDSSLLPYAECFKPESCFEDLVLPEDVQRRLMLLTRQKVAANQGLVWYFQGPYGVGRQTTAEALCHELGIGLLVIDGERLLNQREGEFPEAVSLALREALLQGAALYWQGIDPLLEESKRPLLEALLKGLEEQPGLAFLAGHTTWEPADALRQVPFVRLEFPRPGPAGRARLWSRSLNGDLANGPDADLYALTGKFRLSGGQIRDAVTTARNLARWRDPQNGQLTMDDLYAACRLQSNRKLATLAQKITPHYKWEDIVLPPDRMLQLREICIMSSTAAWSTMSGDSTTSSPWARVSTPSLPGLPAPARPWPLKLSPVNWA
jgi:hypothetical protein